MAIGIGCVAIVVFVLQVNLRMPVLAGLALIAVYVVPALVLDDGAPWWAFAFVASAWMVLLISDERVGLVSWGRLLRRNEGRAGSSAVSGLGSAALRLGVVAIVIAIALPVLIPSLADAVLGRHNTGFGSATSTDPAPTDGVRLDPFASLRRDLLQQPDVQVFHYTTSAANPSYLRVVVLEQYQDEKWSPKAFDPATSRRVADDASLSTDVGEGVATTAQSYDLVADKLANPMLPVPENATLITGLSGQWYDDAATGTIFGIDSTTKGAAWKVDAVDARPTTDQLQASVIGQSPDLESLRSTTNIPASLGELARSVTASATTNLERAVLLQRYFRGQLHLLPERRGRPVRFGARVLPARQVGLLPAVRRHDGADGPRTRHPGARRGRLHARYPRRRRDVGRQDKDAHAWPELLFPSVGWVRFEPTPRTVADGANLNVPGYAAAVPTSPAPNPTASASSGTGNNKLDDLLNDGAAASAPFDGPEAGTSADQWRARGLVALLVLGLLVAAVPAVWRWARRRRRLSASASVEDAWEELRDTARDLGIEWSDARTPRQAVATVITGQHLSGEVAEAATRVGRVTERSRYAATAPSTEGLSDDVSAVRTALLERMDRPTRVRAALLPASLRRTED